METLKDETWLTVRYIKQNKMFQKTTVGVIRGYHLILQLPAASY